MPVQKSNVTKTPINVLNKYFKTMHFFFVPLIQIKSNKRKKKFDLKKLYFLAQEVVLMSTQKASLSRILHYQKKIHLED